MRNFKLVLFAVLMSLVGVAYGMDGVFDRSAEVEKYIGLMQSADTGTLSVVAKEIDTSGIADPRLAAALSERLLKDAAKLSSKREDETYGVWMCRALASFGIDEYVATLKSAGDKARVPKIRSACHDAMATIAWNRAKNQVMASRQNYQEGDNPAVSRLTNLLMSDDFSFKHYGAERMNWERILDPKLMAAIAPQVKRYADGGYPKITVKDEDTISNFIKLLGYSKNVEYRPLLQSVIDSKNSGISVKRHAKYALDKLF